VAALAPLALCAQTLVVNRAAGGLAPVAQIVERPKGAYADSFRIGGKGEVWMIEAIRVWAMPAASPACPKELGQQVEKVTLYGALDNPPVPGVPVCDCHALVALADAPLTAGGASLNPNVTLTPENYAYRIDFRDVRWSIPGDSEALFTVRATPRRRGPPACPAASGWALAAMPAQPGHRLHLLNEKGVPVGLEEPQRQPRIVNIQVWARRTQ